MTNKISFKHKTVDQKQKLFQYMNVNPLINPLRNC